MSEELRLAVLVEARLAEIKALRLVLDAAGIPSQVLSPPSDDPNT